MIHNGLSSLQLIWKTNFWPSRLLGPTSEDMSGDQVDVRAKALLRKGPNQEGRASQHTTDPSTTTVRWPEPQWPGGHRGACGSFPKNLRQGKIGSSLKNPGPCFSCGQMGHLRQDCPLMECDIRWEVHPTRRAKVAWNPPPLMVLIRVGQWLVTALLNAASSASMMQAYLVPKGLPTPSQEYTAAA